MKRHRAASMAVVLLGLTLASSVVFTQGGASPSPSQDSPGATSASQFWVAKSRGGVYVPPNRPLTRLSDLKAKHAGQTTWSELVVKDLEMQAEYHSAAPGTQISKRMHPDTAEFWVVVAGEMRFDIQGQAPVAATRGSIVNVPKGIVFAYEVTGNQPALFLEMNPINFQTLYPAEGPAPATAPGLDTFKVSFSVRPGSYTQPNMPHWNLFEAVRTGGPGGAKVLWDHLFANPIFGYADPNDPANPNRGDAASAGRGGAGGRGAAGGRGNDGAFNPKSVFGHLHAGPAEWWIVQSGRIRGRFENSGEFIAGEGDVLYAPPFTWHQMGFDGPGLSCRLAIGAYSLINMNPVQ